MSKFFILHDHVGFRVIVNVEHIVDVMPSIRGSCIRMLNRKQRLYVMENIDEIIEMIKRGCGDLNE